MWEQRALVGNEWHEWNALTHLYCSSHTGLTSLASVALPHSLSCYYSLFVFISCDNPNHILGPPFGFPS